MSRDALRVLVVIAVLLVVRPFVSVVLWPSWPMRVGIVCDLIFSGAAAAWVYARNCDLWDQYIGGREALGRGGDGHQCGWRGVPSSFDSLTRGLSRRDCSQQSPISFSAFGFWPICCFCADGSDFGPWRGWLSWPRAQWKARDEAESGPQAVGSAASSCGAEDADRESSCENEANPWGGDLRSATKTKDGEPGIPSEGFHEEYGIRGTAFAAVSVPAGAPRGRFTPPHGPTRPVGARGARDPGSPLRRSAAHGAHVATWTRRGGAPRTRGGSGAGLPPR